MAGWGADGGVPLPTRPWPDGAAIAVALSLDLDYETPWEADRTPTLLETSRSDYGARVGMWRLVELFEAVGAGWTAFIPAIALQRHEGDVRRLVDECANVEIASHGLDHVPPTKLTPGDERRRFEEAQVLFASLGYAPVGYRAPSFDPTPTTLSLLEEFGYVYDSSLMGADEPYSLSSEGRAAALVEVPVEWTHDDATYFSMERWGSIRPVGDHDSVRHLWLASYRRAREEGGLFQLTLHPDLVGRRSCIDVLKRLLDKMVSDGGVWFGRHVDVAQHCQRLAEEKREWT